MAHRRSETKRDFLIACGISVLALGIFWLSPVHQLTDSHYSLLVSESLLRNRSFALETYNIPRLTPEFHDHTWKNGNIHQLEVVGNHLYYYMPPGSSVLSLPFVAVLNRLGISATKADNSYSPQGEVAMEGSVAALLMAISAAVFFLTARLVLPRFWSLIIACAATFGTQIWSTSSRALWADTWGILLASGVVYLILAHELKVRRLNPVLLASLLSWMYFVRPSNAVTIVIVTLYLFTWHRSLFARYVMTGSLWLVGFFIYSWIHYQHLLPTYFRVNRRLSIQHFFTAIAGNLVSPSRGLLIYVPVVIFLGFVVFHYRSFIKPRRLLWVSLAISIAFLLVISTFDPWWAGASFGPRYLAPLVPWFVSLAIMGIKAMLEAERTPGRRVMFAGVVLLIVSISIQAIGAFSTKAWRWNAIGDLDHDANKVWDIRYPQLLAPFVKPPLPTAFPPVRDYIAMSSEEAQPYLPYGWSVAEPAFRWTDGNEAAIVFSSNEPTQMRMVLHLVPFLVPQKLQAQRVQVLLNARLIHNFELWKTNEETIEISLPAEAMRERNVLTLRLPDAASPSSFNLNLDERYLGLAVHWIGFRSNDVETKPLR